MTDLGPELVNTIADKLLLEVQCDRLEKLAKLHDMQKEEALDMQEYFVVPEEYHNGTVTWAAIVECGTPSCSLGWASTQFKTIKEAFLNNNQVQAACNFFGVTLATQDALFGTEQRTPTEQAALIREVIKSKRAKAAL